MPTEFQYRAWLGWLTKARIIVITFLLGIELATVRLTTTNVPVRGYISVILLWYTIALFQVLLVYTWRFMQVQARLQILTDLAFTTAIIYVTGDVDTSFNFLYPIIIFVASVLLPRTWAYITAGTSFVLFSLTLELTHYGILRSYAISPHSDERSLHIVVAVNLCAYFAVAYLASYLSAKLRQEDVQALENLQALHENIINSMSGGLITTDLRGHVTFLNAAGEKLLERRSSDLFGKKVDEFFLDELPKGDPVREKGELRILTPSGREKILGMRISPLQVPDHGVLGNIYAFADLTDIRRLENELRMRDRLSAIGRMAAGIAHEIRNPLSSIAGSVKVLSKMSALNDDQAMLVDIVTRESERLNAIISDFLIYSREKKFKLSSESLVSLLDDTLTLLENHPQVTARGEGRISIVRNYASTPAYSVVDGDKIKQVFWNICENAIRAMRQGGTLTVTLEARQSDRWGVTFSDTGPGLSPLQLEKIFEPFQSQFEGGTGLGLAIVYQIVQAHEGKISARSVPGQGAQFCLELARSEAPQLVQESAQEEKSLRVAHG